MPPTTTATTKASRVSISPEQNDANNRKRKQPPEDENGQQQETDKKRILELIERVFLPHPHDELYTKQQIQKALTELANLCLESVPHAAANRAVLVQTRGFTLVVQAMQEFSDNTQLHSEGCRVLQNMSVGEHLDETASSITLIGGIEAIVQSNGEGSSKIRHMNRSILGALAVLAGHSETCQKILKVGALESTLTFVNNNGNSRPVQELGCLFLTNLIAGGMSRSVILGAGGLEVAAKILRVHSQHGDLCDQARSIINSLVDSSEGTPGILPIADKNETELENNEEERDKRKIVELVMKGLRVCANGDDSAVEKIMLELRDLFFEPKPHADRNLLVFHQSGAAVAILQAMIKYKDREGVLTLAMRALQNSTWKGSIVSINAVTASVSLLGGFEMIFQAMEKFPHIESIQRSGCGALHNFSLSVECRERLLNLGGIEAVIKAMSLFPSNPQNVQWGCLFLKRMVNHNKERVRDLFFEKGGVGVVGKAIENQ